MQIIRDAEVLGKLSFITIETCAVSVKRCLERPRSAKFGIFVLVGVHAFIL